MRNNALQSLPQQNAIATDATAPSHLILVRKPRASSRGFNLGDEGRALASTLATTHDVARVDILRAAIKLLPRFTDEALVALHAQEAARRAPLGVDVIRVNVTAREIETLDAAIARATALQLEISLSLFMREAIASFSLLSQEEQRAIIVGA